MLTHERLLEVLSYDPTSGTFIRKSTGRLVGASNGGDYGTIKIDRKTYKAHRLAWFYVKREWPASDIDHRDLNKGNNRFLNLREASESLNKRNSPTYRSNKVGLKGVCLNKRGGKFRAQISINGSTKRIGSFASAEEAHAAYVAEATRLFGEFARAA